MMLLHFLLDPLNLLDRQGKQKTMANRRNVASTQPLLDAPARKIGARNLQEQYMPAGRPGIWSTLLWAPADLEKVKISNTIRGYIMELVGVILFALVTNMAVSLSTATANTLLSGVLVGVLAGGSYYMANCWLRTTSESDSDYELARHLSWSVSLGHALVFRLGLVYLLFYLIVQTIGAAIAGGFLYYFNNGVVPFSLTTAAVPAGPIVFDYGQSWCLEILGSAFIVFSIIYNNYLSYHIATSDGKPKEEHKIHHGHYLGGFMRGLWTAIFLSKAAYSFDPVVYIAGAIGTCSSAAGCLGGASNAWPFYVFVPLLGALGAAILYLPLIALFHWGRTDKTEGAPKRRAQRASTEGVDM
jgi:glycerol uptake facilitator-like aquaporin